MQDIKEAGFLKRLLLAISFAVCCVLLARGAFAEARFKVGDRVMVQTTKEVGTVVEVDEQNEQCKIRFDSHPEYALLYYMPSPNLQLSSVPPPAQRSDTPGPSAPNSAPRANPAGGPGAANPAVRAGFEPADLPYPSSQEPASEALFKRLIKIRYSTIYKKFDTTVSVKFKSFKMGAPIAHEDIYAGDHPAPYAHGHIVKATPVRAACDVLIRYADPLSKDYLYHKDTDWLGFISAQGQWTIKEMQEHNPNASESETFDK